MRHVLQAILTTGGVVPLAAAQPYDYAFFDLGQISGGSTQALGINDDADVVGRTHLNARQAFAWSCGEVFDLARVADVSSTAWDVNDNRSVAGSSGRNDISVSPVAWINGSFVELGTLGGVYGEAFGINNLNEIVGSAEYEVGNGQQRAFHWCDGTMIDLGTLEPDGRFSSASDINDAGLIVGESDAPVVFKPVVWENGQIQELMLLDANQLWGCAYSVNELGQIAGLSHWFDDEAVIWSDKSCVPFSLHEPMYGDNSLAYAINDLGEAVGFIYDEILFDFRAFVWRDGEMRLLNDLIPPNTGRNVDVAWDINNAGQITGNHNLGFGVDLRGFLASPVYPTMTLAQPSPGLSGMNNTVTITDAVPAASVYLTYGTTGGGEYVGNCDLQDGVAVQIDSPTVIGPFVADGSGTVVTTMFVPSGASNLGDILIQAVDPANCQVSQLVVEAFE